MTAPLLTQADQRLALARKNMQNILRTNVNDASMRVFADTEFLDNTDVIPLKAGIIGQIVLSAQQILAGHAADMLGRKLKLTSVPRITPDVTERPGVDKATEYSRPFYEALQASRDGKSDAEAIARGQRRLQNLTATDLQMAKVRAARITLRAGGRQTYRRVTTSANPCALCQIAATQIYYTEDLMPIHQGEPGCQCEVEPDEAIEPMSHEDAQNILDSIPKPQKPKNEVAQELRSLLDKAKADVPGNQERDELDEVRRQGVDPDELKDFLAVREHGEIGPVLTWAHQSFTGPEDLLHPPSLVATPTGGEKPGPRVSKSIADRARAHLAAIDAQAKRLAS